MSEPEAEALRAMAWAGATKQVTALPAQAVLRSADCLADVAVADAPRFAVSTTSLWRARLRELGPTGLADEPKGGRLRKTSAHVLSAILGQPEDATSSANDHVLSAVIQRCWSGWSIVPPYFASVKNAGLFLAKALLNPQAEQ